MVETIDFQKLSSCVHTRARAHTQCQSIVAEMGVLFTGGKAAQPGARKGYNLQSLLAPRDLLLPAWLHSLMASQSSKQHCKERTHTAEHEPGVTPDSSHNCCFDNWSCLATMGQIMCFGTLDRILFPLLNLLFICFCDIGSHVVQTSSSPYRQG